MRWQNTNKQKGQKKKGQTINYEWRMRTKSITSRKIQEKPMNIHTV